MHAAASVVAPAPADLSDLQLARNIAAGDETAFVTLMRRHNRMLYRTVRSILKDDAEAEDALQDAYLLAYRKIGQFSGESKLSTWLARIVINQGLERLRKRSRRVVIPFESDMERNAESHTSSEVKEDSPEKAAMRAEARRLIERKIDDLPAVFRTVFVLRALEELTVEETASCLGLPEATVRTRFFRARGLLRESLAHELDAATNDAFAFAGGRCDRIVARVLEKLEGLRTHERQPDD